MDRADMWEANADERERLADERDSVADERDRLADERERLADRHERAMDQRANAWQAGSTGEPDGAVELRDAQAALDRAQAAVRRAEAQLARARQTAARVAERDARRAATILDRVAAQESAGVTDEEEHRWLAERRDFVAAERDDVAARREAVADERDAAAAVRERRADQREHQALDREQRLDRTARDPTGVVGSSAGIDPPKQADRAGREDQRERAAARRRDGALARARVAGVWGPQAYGPMLVASFAELAQQLFGSDDLADVLSQVLRFTVDAVAGCDWAGVTLLREGRAVGGAATDPVAAALGDVQAGGATGPAHSALHDGRPVYVPHLADSPWPALTAAAAQLGVSSALCHGLFVHRSAQWSALGTLTLYSAAPEAFKTEDQEFVSIVSAYLSVAVAIAQRQDDIEHREAALHRGLGTRDVIGQAKGILMERQRLSAGEAFDLLRRTSQRLNRKLADIAEHLAETGNLP